MNRVFNFSAGPAVLPESVLAEAQEHLLNYHGCGFSIMEASHRGPQYDAVHQEAIANLGTLLGLSDDYQVLFLTGGATAQFALVPMNLRGAGQSANYSLDGAWAKKAVAEAKITGDTHVAGDFTAAKPLRCGSPADLDCPEGAAYLHITSNETIEGVQWKEWPETDAPLVADMSSEILSREIDVSKFGFIYAGAQKNLGPSGVTIGIIRKDLLDRAPDTVPSILRYKTHADANSLKNTPPTFSIYMVCLVTRWLLAEGGVAAMQTRNERKAGKLYDTLDGSAFWSPSADKAFRSPMNVTFRIANQDLEPVFLEEAAAEGMVAMKGHRSVGGIRASIYNAFPEAGVDALVSFMNAFEAKHG